jgi:hypothetical protein
MAREMTTKLTCDFEGCRKHPLQGENDHVVVTVVLETQDGLRVPAASGEALDFCSFDHAAKHLKTVGDLAGKQAKSLRETQAAPPDA